MKDTHIIHANISEQELKDQERNLPSDTHLVRWRKPNWRKKSAISAVKAYRMVDIFDLFHDKGLVVLEIKQGYGRIKPRLWSPT